VVDLRVGRGGVEGACAPASVALRGCLSHACDVLNHTGIDGYDVEARILCEWITGRSRIDFVIHPDDPVSAEIMQALDIVLEKRLSGMPVYRILGFREFYGLRFRLSEATLEPRSDTEVLVDQVLDIIKKNSKLESPLRILDLGTGTGAIALALLSNLPDAHALGVDISAQALEIARQNADSTGLSPRFATLQSDWFERVSGKFDVIVSNPPYIRTGVISQLDIEVRNHDPLIALDGGIDGLVHYHEIARKSADYLEPNGVVCVEIGFDQAIDIKQIFFTNGYDLLDFRKDFGMRDRALAFTLHNA
jgi:release factor glutamine methyltransferase